MPKLNNSKHEKFAQLVAMGQCSNAAAYRAVYKSCAKDAEVKSYKLANVVDVALRIKELRAQLAGSEEKLSQAEGRKRFLTLDQKREFLARVVNTPAEEVDERSPLCQSAEFSDSPTRSSRKLRMPDKLRALELDAKLAGELREKHEVDVVDRRASAVELQERLDAATPLLRARMAKEGK